MLRLLHIPAHYPTVVSKVQTHAQFTPTTWCD